MSDFRQQQPFNTHSSLPALPSYTHEIDQNPISNTQNDLQIHGLSTIESPIQPLFEPLPDILAIPLDPTAQRHTQNTSQAQLLIPSSAPEQYHDQHFFEPLPDILATPLEPTTDQPALNLWDTIDTQPQVPIPNLNQSVPQSHENPLFEPLPDILPPSEETTLPPTWDTQTQVPITSSNSFQDAMYTFEPSCDPRPSPDTLLQHTLPQPVHPSQSRENRQVLNTHIRRTVSKPAIPTKQRLIRQINRKRPDRDPTASLTRTKSFQPRSVNPLNKPFKEQGNYPSSQARNASLSSVMQNKSFKDSLRSVISRSSKPMVAPSRHRTQSTLQPRFPDRGEPYVNTGHHARNNGRDGAGSSAMHAMERTGDIPVGVMKPRSEQIGQGPFMPVNQSTPNLERQSSQRNSNPPSLTIRKRPASCSALPSRKSSKEIGKKKRPCDMVDQAIAEGKELSKEQLRVLRNRQHAFNSRERTKAKEAYYNEENAMLRERIIQLETENEQLRTMRDILLGTAPMQTESDVQVRPNAMQDIVANQTGEQNEAQAGKEDDREAAARSREEIIGAGESDAGVEQL